MAQCHIGNIHGVLYLLNMRSSVLQVLVIANAILISLILFTMMIEAIRSPKLLLLQEPHGPTFQKTALFSVTAVKTSNLT
jgi:hypothetical protein